MANMNLILKLTCFALLPVFSIAAQQTEVAKTDLTNDNWQAWFDHIAPNDDELVWRSQIPWLSTFSDGVLAADKADKPLLLWVMNGHPLACT